MSLVLQVLLTVGSMAFDLFPHQACWTSWPIAVWHRERMPGHQQMPGEIQQEGIVWCWLEIWCYVRESYGTVYKYINIFLLVMHCEWYIFDDIYAECCRHDQTIYFCAQDHTCYTVDTAGAEGFLRLLPVYLDHVLFPTLKARRYIFFTHLQ